MRASDTLEGGLGSVGARTRVGRAGVERGGAGLVGLNEEER